MLTIDAALVARLIASQLPQWAHLPVVPVEPGGVDNRTFRLGDALSVRLPSAEGYSAQVEKEHRWLPVLAPQLPLPIPTPVAMGAPGEGYPYRWSVYRWLDGATPSDATVADQSEFAVALADFLAALQRIDAADGPAPGQHNFWRGGPLTTYDTETRESIELLRDRIDADAATAVWDAALAAPYTSPPVWFHGDVASGNLLTRDGRLSAVIDFGTSGIGDPACDVVIAWTFLDGVGREAFRASYPADTATWARGRGWALWKALITMVPSHDQPHSAEDARRVLETVVAEHLQLG